MQADESILSMLECLQTNFSKVDSFFLDQEHETILKTISKNKIVNTYKLYLIQGELELNIFQLAARHLLALYPQLKKNFFQEDQFLHQSYNNYKKEDIFFYIKASNEETIFKIVQQKIKKPFHLFSKKPLFNLILFIVNNKKNFLFLNCHYLVCTDVSFIAKIIMKLYTDILNKQPFKKLSPNAAVTISKPSTRFLKQIYNDGNLTLPYDYSQRKYTCKGDLISRQLDPSLFNYIKKLSKKNGFTPATILHGIYSIFIHSYSNQRAINISVPLHGREAELELDHLMVNKTIIGSKVHQDSTVFSHIQQIHKNYSIAQSNRTIPFYKLLEYLKDKKHILHEDSLFQVGFHYDEYWELPHKESLKFSEIIIHNGASKFHLNFMIKFPEKNCPVLCLEFCSQLIKKQTAARFLSHIYQMILTYIQNPNSLLSVFYDLHYLEKEIIKKVNAPFVEGSEISLTTIVRNVINNNTPGHFKMAYEHHYFNFKNIQKDVLCLAGRILEEKNKKSRIIAVYLTDNYYQVIAIISISYLGFTYLPFNRDEPIEKIKKIMAKSPEIDIITDNEKLKNDDEVKENIIFLINLFSDKLSQFNQINKLKNTKIDDNAYIIFTSGTTGDPKGVIIRHRNVFNTIECMINRFKLKQKDVFLMVSRISFDLSVFDLFASLFLDATLIVTNEKRIFEPVYLFEILLKNKVTIWNSSPGVMKILINFISSNSEHIYSSKNLQLRYIFLSGDWVTIELANDIRLLFPQAILIVLGGATEAGIWSNYFIVNKCHKNWLSLPYGRALTNQSLHVLNHMNYACPVNVVGELFIGGKSVARGYYKDFKQTQLKFIVHPIFGRIYKTGDLAKINHMGQVIILGRNDEQVKIRGYRIEIKAIEFSLMQSGYIKQIKILAIGTHEHRLLVAFIVPASSKHSITHLKEYLKSTLPIYMIPQRFIPLEHFPFTVNGKIDREVLIKIFEQRNTIQNNFILDEEDKNLAPIKKLFTDVLKISKTLSHNDNFFELGGNSITASYVIVELNRYFTTSLTVEDLFNYPTPIQLKNLISSREISSVKPLSPKKNSLRKSHLSSNQLRLAFIENKEDNISPAYNMNLFYSIEGEFNHHLFLSSCKKVICRHKILNVHIKQSQEGLLYQYYSDKNKFKHEFFSLIEINLPIGQKQGLAASILTNASRIPFDLENSQKVKIILVEISKNLFYLLMQFHHIIADGESIKKIFHEIKNAYQTTLGEDIQQDNPKIVKPTFDYFDYIQWMVKFEKSNDYKMQLSYWNTQIKKIEDNCLINKENNKNFFGKYSYLYLDSSDHILVKNKVRNMRSSEFIYLLTVFAFSLRKLFNYSQIVIGTTVASRPYGFEDTIGFFANTLPIIINIKTNDTFESLHEKIRRLVFDLLEHQWIPFEMIVNIARKNGIKINENNPIFQIAFVYLEEIKILNGIPRINVTRLPLNNGTAKFYLSLYVHEKTDGMRFEFEYNHMIFSPNIILKLMHEIKKMIIPNSRDISYEFIE